MFTKNPYNRVDATFWLWTYQVGYEYAMRQVVLSKGQFPDRTAHRGRDLMLRMSRLTHGRDPRERHRQSVDGRRMSEIVADSGGTTSR